MPTRGLLDTNIVVHMAALRPDELPDEMVISAVTPSSCLLAHIMPPIRSSGLGA